MLSSATVKGKKLKAQVCLWQEIRPKDMSADDYHDLVAFYAKLIRPHFPLVYDGAGYLGPQVWKAYRPDDSLLDGYALDFYGGDFINKGFKLGDFMPLAGKKPFGLWEIGNTASSHFNPGTTDIQNYMEHITGSLTARLLSGLPVGSVAWFNGPSDPKESGGNEMVGTHPVKTASADISYYKKLYEAINGRFPVTLTARPARR
jgi:hypothetical protein